MLDILKRLNRGLGIRGSMIVTADGIIVASHMGEDLDDNRVAAIASNVIQRTQHTLTEIELRKFSQFILTAVHGKMVFQDIGNAFLVVLTDKSINLDHTLIEIKGAAFKIQSRAKLED
jgi:predicted regulator of Ras-like GTPase activity (Roadblock/LC7/MglB family)